MSYVLLHINEFNYLIFSGALQVHAGRFIDRPLEPNSIAIFYSAGYVKYSSPESYLLCKVDQKAISPLAGADGTTRLRFEMGEVTEITPLTQQAEVLLRPVIQRAHLRVTNPIFESAWHRFVDEEILRERLEAAKAFVSLFGCPEMERDEWKPEPDLYPFILRDLGSGLNEIERRVDSAELGTFEFCVRLANEHGPDWRKSDSAYLNLKQVRVAELASKTLSEQSFLNSPKVCLALRDFENKSRARFGYSPFSLVPFFEFYRTHSRTNGINFKRVRETIQLLMNFGRNDDAADYAHLVGYALGLEEVTPATYFIRPDRFPLFNHNSSSYPTPADLLVTPPAQISDLFATPILRTSSEGGLIPAEEHEPAGEPSPATAAVTVPVSEGSGQAGNNVTEVSSELLTAEGGEDFTEPSPESSMVSVSIKGETREDSFVSDLTESSSLKSAVLNTTTDQLPDSLVKEPTLGRRVEEVTSNDGPQAQLLLQGPDDSAATEATHSGGQPSEGEKASVPNKPPRKGGKRKIADDKKIIASKKS
jgi:hypothetical protein